ncbi:MAG: hypothetical protein EHM93_09140 [Bacteroidales bacterium]|nr:MAG: hypothetical protein EHM93_09140 [Bacteroidales bacterium]
MQPLKSGQVIALWFLRITLALYLFFDNIYSLRQISFESLRFYIAFAFVIFAILLLVGGFLSKPGLTVISGLIIFLLSAYQLFVSYGGTFDVGLILYLFPLSIGFFFLCQGNK